MKAPANAMPQPTLTHRHDCQDEHELAITEQEAQVLAQMLPGSVAHIQVHRVPGFRGVQPLLQPVYRAYGNRTDH